MAPEECFQVKTIGGWQARGVADSIAFIDGVKRVDAADGVPNMLVVAIEGESRPILKEIGHVSGVIRIDPAR